MYLCIYPLTAVVGVERTEQSVSEDVGVVEVCVVVTSPEISCPIQFPFNISLSTADGSAGSSYMLFYHLE